MSRSLFIIGIILNFMFFIVSQPVVATSANSAPNFMPKNAATQEITLQNLTVSISPDSVTASPGDTINLRLKIDWEPKNWKGKANVTIVLSAAGFKKGFQLPEITLENPPIEKEFSFTLPVYLPPLTYEAKIIVEAEGIKSEDNIKLKINTNKIPGFEVLVGVIALIGGLMLKGRRT